MFSAAVKERKTDIPSCEPYKTLHARKRLQGTLKIRSYVFKNKYNRYCYFEKPKKKKIVINNAKPENNGTVVLKKIVKGQLPRQTKFCLVYFHVISPNVIKYTT